MRVRCVGAVVLDERGRLLVVRRRNAPSAGLWSIPGGRIEPGESAEQALAREMLEETGLAAEVGPLLGTVALPAPDGVVLEVEDYQCTVEPGADPRPGDDATDARWVSRTGLDALELVPGLAATLTGWGVMPR